jgi:hypothetical protein
MMAMNGAQLPSNTRKANQEKDIRPVTTLAIQFDQADAEQIQRLATEAGLSMKATASSLLAFALETLARKKRSGKAVSGRRTK